MGKGVSYRASLSGQFYQYLHSVIEVLLEGIL